MIGVVVALLAASLQGTQPPPVTVEAEQAVNPTSVTDHRPDFRAVNPLGVVAQRFRIQMTTNGDTGFASPFWNSPAAPGGTQFPGNATVNSGAMSVEIPYGTGGPALTSILLDWGATYRWRIAMGRTSGLTNWTQFSAPATLTMALPTRTISQHQNNGDPGVASWRFIGVPIAIGTSVPAGELLATVPFLYRLDETTRTWIPMSGSDVLQGGRGYLGWCSPSTVLNLTQGKVMAGIPPVKNGAGRTTTASYVFTNLFSYTTLAAPSGGEITDGVAANAYRGNHVFANPFYARLSWRGNNSAAIPTPYGNISTVGISSSIYKWDGAQYLTYNGTTNVGSAGEWIEPFQAVGITVTSAANTLRIDTPSPPLTGGSQKAAMAAVVPMAAPVLDPDRWHLLLEARSGTAIDTENAFGIDPDADDAWDERDSEEPGHGAASWVNVSIDHESDWTVNPRKYTHDFRRTPLLAGNEIVWTVLVDGNTGLPATLTWPNLADISAADWKFTLEDPATTAVIDLSTVSSYDTQNVTGPSTLTLRATRLKDAPSTTTTGDGGGGGGCGLLGLEGLLLTGWMLLRRGCKMNPH